jgi:hypothetical protein
MKWRVKAAQRLGCTEIQRILPINELQTVTKAVVETVRETLVSRPGLYRRGP